jgi:hypothetical protein
MARRNSDPLSNSYDSPKPRLTTLRSQRFAKRIREDLNGEAQKREAAKISLPKFSWEKKND